MSKIRLAKDFGPYAITSVPEAERPQKLIEHLDKMRKKARSVVLAMEACTKCGACAEQCHTYLGTKDPNNIPTKRAELMRSIYKKYFTVQGRLFGSFVGAKDVDQETIDKWFTYFYQCNECRRCSVVCPFGIDTAEVTIAARQILTYLGMVPEFIMGVAINMYHTGNNMGIPKAALFDNIEFMEEDMKDETGIDIKIPVDKPGAEILYNPSSADFFVNFNTMTGVAKFYHAIGANWTISSDIIEAANFGLFFDEEAMRAHNKRLLDTAKKLGVKKIVQGECGHGWRVARMYTDDLNPNPYPILHILQEAAAYIQDGKLKLNPDANPQLITIHDPCNYARGAGLIEESRIIVNAVAKNVVEMTPNRERNFCCGGGSGLLMEEFMDVRMKLGWKKAEQVKATGAQYCATPCSICKAQLPLVFKHHKVNVDCGGIMDLVGKAIVFD